MALSDKKTDRLLTIAIIIFALAGIVYFGVRAVKDNSPKDGENPFAYDIESFKKVDKSRVHYKEVGPLDPGLPEIFAIALGPDEQVYVSGPESVVVLDKTGGTVATVKTTDTAYSLAVDKNGDLYLGTVDHVAVYDAKGAPKARWESLGEKAVITSVAISQDAVFVADAGNLVVWKYTKTGTKTAEIGKKNPAKDIPGFIIPSAYFDVAMDPDGFLWVVNPGRHSLENYTLDGNFRTSWGEYGMAAAEFCGCCNPIHIAIMADGSFVTSEKGIPRVKIYDRLGQLVCLVAAPDQFAEGTVGLDLAVDSSGRIYVLDPGKKKVRIFEKEVNNE